MSFMFIPVQFSGKQLFWVILGFQGFFFLFGELPGSTGNSTANSAHLGGILGAFIYERYLLARPTLADFFRRLFASRETAKAPSWQKRAEAVKAKTGNRFSIKTKRAGSVKKEVDRILDKINAEGFGALSEEEKHTLDNAKDKL